jgi:O-antigen/teichoic acid export membrane protein
LESSKTKDKRIVKNTLYMYIRMFVMMLISLFTARIIFNALGVNDYGTFNVVGSIIVFFAFLNNGLSSATKRFITAELESGTTESGRNVFSTCLVAHMIIAGIVFILAETIGVWAVNSLLNIPEGRMTAANVVYQFSVLSSLVGIMQSPYSSAIVAHEKMNIYAYISVFDATCKLLIAFLIQALPGDKLMNYGVLLFIESVIAMMIFRIYCHRHFRICRWKKPDNRPLLKSIFSFTSWSLLGQASIVGTNQGVTLLVNYFYNVAVNASMGISNTIVKIVSGFVVNFQTAFNPQIIKSYVSKDWKYLQSLIQRSSKITSFLILIFLIPLYFEIDRVLLMWLGSSPQFAVEFCRWTLLSLYLDGITGPLWMTVNAQTNIKGYQIATFLTYGSNLLISWLFLLIGGFPPYIVVIIRTVIFGVLMFVRLAYAKRFFKDLDVRQWLDSNLLRPAIIAAVTSVVLFLFVGHVTIDTRILHVIAVTAIALAIIVPGYFFFVFNKSERAFLIESARNQFRKRIN